VVERVFVVDDDPLAVRALAELLTREAQLEVETFTSARAARAAAHTVPPDAVIVGLRIGDEPGPALIRELEAIDPQVASLLLTSAADPQATAEAVARVGSVRAVQKPADTADLLGKLRAQLERRQLICDLQALSATLAQRDRALSASRRQAARTAAELATTHNELATATERLVQAEQLAAVGRVLAGVAHELDRQLALVGYAEAIKSRVSGDPELVELADIIVHAQKRLVATVTEIRDFVTTSASGEAAALDREPADVGAVVEEALNLMQFDPDVRKRTIERLFHAHPLAALHRQKFLQVVLNLVSNSVLATEPGATVTVELDVDRDHQLAVLTVVDRGTGMPPEVLRRLGEPFFTTRGDRGSGLGVGICKRIVEEHGGTLEFESEVGLGTTARVTVPLLAGTGEAA
jgi:signal transduction histidine kinase